ncbi:MAG: ImmA/IrrE family metallo-endopeptidase, partial [Candidatus Micrarchaeota archaeon]
MGIFLDVPNLSYDDIRPIANGFLTQHWPNGGLPVKIDLIAERELGILVLPFSNLRQWFGIDGYHTQDGTTIYVDKYFWDADYYRHNFTVAHELGHLQMHRDVFAGCRFANVEEWKKLQSSLLPESLTQLEMQAHNFAGLVLVPPGPLLDAIETIVESHGIQQRIMRARDAGLSPETIEEKLRM